MKWNENEQRLLCILIYKFIEKDCNTIKANDDVDTTDVINIIFYFVAIYINSFKVDIDNINII